MALHTLQTSYIFPKHVPQLYCGKIGSLLHIIWECPSLTSFWRQVFCLLSSTSYPQYRTRQVPKLPQTGGDPYSISSTKHYSKKMKIPRLPRIPSIPNLSEVINTVHLNYTYECLLVISSLKCTRFDQTWSTWTDNYVSMV